MKLILNSLWGKLCQNPNKLFVFFINDYEELLSHVCDKKYESVYFDVLNSNVARVICNCKEENNYKINKVCVSIGSYITCYSRLKLLESINKLNPKDVLYYDTDSIIYYSKYCEEILETGSKLGNLSSELKDGEYITTFISTGPKSYSYVTNKGIEITHVKGFKFKRNRGDQGINPNYLYEMLENHNVSFEIQNTDTFRVNPQLHICKKNELKNFSFTFDKRQILQNYTTVPWGYI